MKYSEMTDQQKNIHKERVLKWQRENKEKYQEYKKDYQKQYTVKYREKNKDKLNESKKIWANQNKHIVKKIRRKWVLKNHKKVKADSRHYGEIYRYNLTDSYLRGLLIHTLGFDKSDVEKYPELIKTYREILKTKRLCRSKTSKN